MSRVKNEVGNTHNRWFVESRAENNKHRKAMYNCICICGTKKVISGSSLRNGNSKSCGCYDIEKLIERNKLPKSVETLQNMSEANKGNIPWNKGKTGVYSEESLQKMSDNQCDYSGENNPFFGKEHSIKAKKKISEANTTHGETGSRLFGIWHGMKTRVNNPNVREYKYYGGKDIKICSEWENDFMAFRDWALANGYADDLTIDRINSNGNYESDNCQWITLSENTKKRWRDQKNLCLKN